MELRGLVNKLEFNDNKTYKIEYVLTEDGWIKTIYVHGKDLTVNDEGYFLTQKYYYLDDNKCRFDYCFRTYIDINYANYKVFVSEQLSARYKRITEYKGVITDMPERDEAYKTDHKSFIIECRKQIRKYIKRYRTSTWVDVLFGGRKEALKEVKWYRKQYYKLKKMLSELD